MKARSFLLADDDKDDVEMFCEILMGIDNTILCHCVENGKEALRILDELAEKPDLIFLDINMPVMNGWQCLKQLKEDKRYQQIPVVVYSTSSHRREIDIAMELGALCFLTKPSDFKELQEIFRVIINNLGANLLSALYNFHKNSSNCILAVKNE